MNETKYLELILHNFDSHETIPIRIPEVKNGSNEYWDEYGFERWVDGPTDFRNRLNLLD